MTENSLHCKYLENIENNFFLIVKKKSQIIKLFK